MNRFNNTSLNRQIAAGILNHIVEKVLECFDLMLQDCEYKSEKIANNEIAIRDYLFYNYLNNDTVMRGIGFDDFMFIPEVPENYVDNRPIGRADLQVFSAERFRHRERYFIIECKRIDGNLTLNREYIDEGIRRFVGKMPKYTSYYKMNCMLDDKPQADKPCGLLLPIFFIKAKRQGFSLPIFSFLLIWPEFLPGLRPPEQ